MQNAEALTGQQIDEFLTGSEGIGFTGESRAGIYAWTERLLVAQEFMGQSKTRRGAIRKYASRVTGLSLPQITRLIRSYARTGTVELRTSLRRRFPGKYTERDVTLLAEVDRAHERLSGPATQRILRREHEEYGKAEYLRLAGISVSHIYNLRDSLRYRRQAAVFEPTRPSANMIGERRRPEPQGRPGYLRVDTVHQGDWDGAKGVYHINAVDTVTQWQVVGCVETISENHLVPVLESMLHQFPFRILGFHCDNGSEFINRRVAQMLNKLLVEFTKSRAYRTTDNALVEGKNGAVVRKHIGYGPIGSAHAEAWQKFYTAYFNPYLNYHRPCGFATVVTDRRGKHKRRYRANDYRTPYEKLISLKKWQQYLKPGIPADLLARQSKQRSDTEAALRMQKAKLELLAKCRSRPR